MRAEDSRAMEQLRRLVADHETASRQILDPDYPHPILRPRDEEVPPTIPELPGRSVLIVSPDLPPSIGRATSGAGLRAWGLAEGLRSRGHEVTIGVPDETANAAAGLHPDIVVFPRHNVDRFIRQRSPDVVVFQHWLLARELRSEYRYTVIDLHGPLLLETLFRQGAEVTDLMQRKIEAFSRAHFFTCAGQRQKQYFIAWLLMAGFDVRRLPIEVIPFSLPPQSPAHDAPEEVQFVFGGHFLPWQNPATGLSVLVEELEALRSGHLWLFGGYHAWVETGPLPAFERIRNLLAESGRATVSPPLDRTSLLERYRRMSVAWDLMPYNSERGMAFTSRTAEYLWAGLPVVHQKYAELSEHIAEYEAGWLVDAEDPEAIRRTIREILRAPEEVRRRSRNAQSLARNRLDWSKTIGPLDEFIREPERRQAQKLVTSLGLA